MVVPKSLRRECVDRHLVRFLEQKRPNSRTNACVYDWRKAVD